MRIVISGSRGITDEKAVERILQQYIGSGDLVITGGARGVDTIAHAWARRMFCKTKVIPADWDTHGKAAGPIRNRQMLEDAGMLIAIWDGKSRGTLNTIKTAMGMRIETHIHYLPRE